MVDSLRLVSMLGVTCPLTCAQRRESCVLGTLRAAARAAALARASAALDALLRRLVPQTSSIARCARARLLAVSVFDRPNEFLSCKAYLGMLTIALQSSDEARNFIERTQPRREPPMSMEDQRSDIGHCPQTALWDETVKRNVRHGKRDRRRVAEERAHERESARESICNQSYFSLTCADKSEQPTGPRTNNNTAAAHAASVLVVHQCGARESCLWSPPASAHFALAF